MSFSYSGDHMLPTQMAPKSMSMPANLSQSLSENSCSPVIIAPAAPAVVPQQVLIVFIAYLSI